MHVTMEVTLATTSNCSGREAAGGGGGRGGLPGYHWQLGLCVSSKDPGFSQRDAAPGPPWTGQAGGDHPPASPAGQPRGRRRLRSPAFPAAARVGRSPPQALPRGRTSQAPGRKRVQGSWTGSPAWSPPSEVAQEVRAPPPPRRCFAPSQQQTLPKKTLVMATAPAKSGRTRARQLCRAGRRRRGGARAGPEVGLGSP